MQGQEQDRDPMPSDTRASGSKNFLPEQSHNVLAEQNHSPSITMKQGGHPPADLESHQALAHATREGSGGALDMDSALNQAFTISEQQLEVEPQLMQDLRKFNKRYMNDK